MEQLEIPVKYDALTKRYTVTCPECPRTVVRSNKASAVHNMRVHLIYQHDKQL